jgi:hypothetical protein
MRLHFAPCGTGEGSVEFEAMRKVAKSVIVNWRATKDQPDRRAVRLIVSQSRGRPGAEEILAECIEIALQAHSPRRFCLSACLLLKAGFRGA